MLGLVVLSACASLPSSRATGAIPEAGGVRHMVAPPVRRSSNDLPASESVSGRTSAPAEVEPSCRSVEQRGASAGRPVEVFSVPAEGAGLSCCVYVRPARIAPATRVVFFENGTGVYTTAHGDLDGLAKSAARDPRAAVVTFDKPGVGTTEAGLTTVDGEVFGRHTLGDLSRCARGAIDRTRALPHVAKSATVLAHGHSEGAQVWLRVLAQAAETDEGASFLDRVEANLLSGLPSEPVTSGAERQLGVFLPFEIEAFRRALAAHDDEYLLLLGMPWRYLEHPWAKESADAVLARLAAREKPIELRLFHGDRDRNAPLGPILALAAKYAPSVGASPPSRLALHLQVYPGASHQLDARLDHDLDAFVDALPPRRP